MADKRSPLKDLPLRNPGQSIREERFDLVYDKLLGPMMVVLVLVVWALLDWFRYYFPVPPAPLVTTTIAVIALLFVVWQFRKYWPRVASLKLAEDGEKAVGQFLEKLREQGYAVFHDIVGQGFNVDHILIGPAGVFTVETKTWRKPQTGSSRIRFDGQALTADGWSPERNPVVQAKAQAHWIKGVLAESTGKSFAVRPVIVFPGWFVESQRNTRSDIWVLEPKALPAFLAQEKMQLVPEDIKLAVFHLSRFVREQERQRTASNL